MFCSWSLVQRNWLVGDHFWLAQLVSADHLPTRLQHWSDAGVVERETGGTGLGSHKGDVSHTIPPDITRQICLPSPYWIIWQGLCQFGEGCGGAEIEPHKTPQRWVVKDYILSKFDMPTMEVSSGTGPTWKADVFFASIGGSPELECFQVIWNTRSGHYYFPVMIDFRPQWSYETGGYHYYAKLYLIMYIYIYQYQYQYIYISHDSSMIVPPFWLGRQVAIPVVLRCRIPAEEFALWHWQGRRNPSGVALLAAAAENLARRAGTQSIVHEDTPKKVISVSDWLRTNENDSTCWILGFIWLISIITILLTLN